MKVGSCINVYLEKSNFGVVGERVWVVLYCGLVLEIWCMFIW